MPYTFEINSVSYEVEFVDSNSTSLHSNNSSSNLGCHWSKIAKIFIDKTLPVGIMQQTIAHEIVHAIVWVVSPIPSSLDEEYMCSFIGCHFKNIYKISMDAFNYYLNYVK